MCGICKLTVFTWKYFQWFKYRKITKRKVYVWVRYINAVYIRLSFRKLKYHIEMFSFCEIVTCVKSSLCKILLSDPIIYFLFILLKRNVLASKTTYYPLYMGLVLFDIQSFLFISLLSIHNLHSKSCVPWSQWAISSSNPKSIHLSHFHLKHTKTI